MIVGIVRETHAGERRVALVPAALPALSKAGLEVLVEPGAGVAAGYPDAEYASKGARIAGGREEVFAAADVVLQVRTLGVNPEAGRADLALLRSGQVLIGLAEPLTAHAEVRALAERGVTLFALELIPRITRAQSMDVLSSMAMITGYKGVLLAATHLPKMFPLMMTAAGTVTPSRLLVVGVGVAGLQAIATARKMGAVVEAYDVRPAVKEQVQSLGAKFVELPLETAGAEGQGGYARAQDEEFYRRQRELMGRVVAENDVVITTAAVPGKRAPLLVTRPMVEGMRPGSVVVDLAAERGGNCEVTLADHEVVHRGVLVLGPTNLPATVPFHASQLYAKNVSTFLLHVVRDGRVPVDVDDEIVRACLVTHAGEVREPRVREALGLAGTPATTVAREP